MRRVIAYVDGFNLYHAIAELKQPHLKWLNLHALAASICGSNETLIGVYYFTAYAGWLPDSVARHREYISALEHVGVRSIIGHFKEKRRTCKSCGATWVQHEEKETDVAIAVKLVADAFTDAYERALVISADSDLGPAIKAVQAHFPAKAINVIAPPGRFAHARDLKPQMQITQGRLDKCLLPATAARSDGSVIFTRPTSYDPPL